MANRRTLAVLFLAAVCNGFSEDAYLLNLDFQDTAHLAAQTGPLPAGVLVPDAEASADFPGALNLGTNGYIRVPGFRSPRGPFTVEARFRVNEYAPSSTRYISDIFNTATWDSGPTQGVGMRIGGGYLYAEMPRESYASDEDYRADIGWYDDGERASASRCIGEFFTAMKGDDRNWKEVVTDRCIRKNVWVHMAGVWDGKDMRIYFDGQDATDTLRVLRPEAAPNLDSQAVAFVGARADGGFDSRHLDGTLDFVRVIDKALSADDVRVRYRATLPASDTLCHGAILPEYPVAGQAVNGLCEFRFRLVVEGACTQPGFKPELKPGDSVEVEIAKDPEFQQVLVKLKVAKLTFKIETADLSKLAGYVGAAYWRARLIPATKVAAAKAGASKGLAKTAAIEAPDWSLSRPFMLDGKSTVGTLQRSPVAKLAPAILNGWLTLPARGASRPHIHSTDGRRLSVDFRREGRNWVARLPEAASGSILYLGWE